MSATRLTDLVGLAFHGLGAVRFWRGFAGFADAADHRLDQAIGAFSLIAVERAEFEFGLAFGVFADSNRQRAAQIVFDVGSLVAILLRIPGVGAQRGEIARLAFWALRSG